MHAVSPSAVRTAGGRRMRCRRPVTRPAGCGGSRPWTASGPWPCWPSSCYHSGISWIGGGLLGVDVFFVLSGFLITSLLCRELARTATVRLGRFWAQRARRLLPALFVLVLGVAAYAYVFRHSIDVAAVRGDALSTLLYVANWHFILSDQGYFVQAAAPSPLLHTWSLAVEEQYYLIWPLVALFVVRRRGVRALAVTAGVGALASAVLMVVAVSAPASRSTASTTAPTPGPRRCWSARSSVRSGPTRGTASPSSRTAWTSTARQRGSGPCPGASGRRLPRLGVARPGRAGPVPLPRGFLVVALAAGAVILSCVTVPASLLPRCSPSGAAGVRRAASPTGSTCTTGRCSWPSTTPTPG